METKMIEKLRFTVSRWLFWWVCWIHPKAYGTFRITTLDGRHFDVPGIEVQ